jgi:hypothetical protein
VALAFLGHRCALPQPSDPVAAKRTVGIGARIGYDAIREFSSRRTLEYGPNMAKIISRKDKRAEAEAAEKKGKTAKKADPKATVKKEPAKRKSRAKSAKEVRLKAFWGVFNQSLKRVALYEFSEKKEADKKAKELTASGKSPHFVQPVKEAVQE